MLWCSGAPPLQMPTATSWFRTWWFYSTIAHYYLVYVLPRELVWGRKAAWRATWQDQGSIKASPSLRKQSCKGGRVPHLMPYSKALLSIHPHSSSSRNPFPLPCRQERSCMSFSPPILGGVAAHCGRSGGGTQGWTGGKGSKAPVPPTQSSAGMRFSHGHSISRQGR